ncbi:MAG: hypothetical protein OES32_19025 [Acidobacteriota bacterium]|nr:hypothetical protein [Acidobacteriota bacterium]
MDHARGDVVMRSTGWLPVAILCVTVLAIGFSWFSSEPDRAYLFDGDRGLPRPEVREWWAYLLPAAVSAGAIAIIVLLAALRSLRRGDVITACGHASVGLLGLLAFTGASLYSGLRTAPPPEPPELPSPRAPEDVFLAVQWSDLARSFEDWRDGDSVPPGVPLGPAGIGLVGHPGIIPFDPFVLHRISFVGLSVREVEALLGPPLSESRSPLPTTAMVYVSRGPSAASGRATLMLATNGPTDRPTSIVRAESIRLQRLQY